MFFILFSFSFSFWSKTLNFHKKIQQIDENNFSVETFFENPPEIVSQQIVRNNYLLFSNDVYVNNCMFILTTNLDDGLGGAIRVRCAYVKLLVEYSTFDSCSARQGGAIFMSIEPSPNKGCIISHVCGCKCSSSQQSNFDYIRVSIGKDSLDYVLESSVILSGKFDHPTSEIIRHRDQDFVGMSLNISNNIVSETGFTISTSESYGTKFTLSYSLFANNTLQRSRLMSFNAERTYQNLTFTNIIGNKHSTYYQSEALLSFYGTPTLYSCSIFNNIEGYTFYTKDYINVNFIHCYIPDDQKTFYGDGIISYYYERDFFINNLSLLQTKLCIVHFYTEKTKHSSINYYNHKTVNKLFRY